MSPSSSELRATALDDYLARRAADGFVVETRTPVHAVIVRRSRLHFLLRRIAPGRAEERLVLSVDQHGAVEAVAAEPVRW